MIDYEDDHNNVITAYNSTGWGSAYSGIDVHNAAKARSVFQW